MMSYKEKKILCLDWFIVSKGCLNSCFFMKSGLEIVLFSCKLGVWYNQLIKRVGYTNCLPGQYATGLALSTSSEQRPLVSGNTIKL